MKYPGIGTTILEAIQGSFRIGDIRSQAILIGLDLGSGFT